MNSKKHYLCLRCDGENLFIEDGVLHCADCNFCIAIEEYDTAKAECFGEDSPSCE